MPKTVDLRQDRNLIRRNFDGYKLSLDPLPLLSQSLKVPPQTSSATEEQYSLLHAELFTLQNLLLADPWERHTTYHVNTLGEVVRSAYDVTTGRPQELETVYRVADETDMDSQLKRKPGDYNYSFRFISEKYCVLCDGINQLLLLETGDRLKAVTWRLVAATKISENDEKRNFIMYDCRLDILKEQKKISCALGHISRPQSTDPSSSVHMLQLHLVKWLQDVESGLWQYSIVDILEGKGSLYYCAFEPKAQSVVVSSNRDISFPTEHKSTTAGEQHSPAQLHDESAAVSGFTWSQSDDDLVLKFDAREGKTKADYNIKCTAQTLTVKCSDEMVFDKALFESVDPDLTTWSFENNYLQVTLMKAKPGMLWPLVLATGLGPKETDANNTTSLPVEQKAVVNLEAPVEDCDFPMDSMDDENRILRFDIDSKEITHSIFLGSTPPLFSTTLRPGFPAAIATRQDIDASLWLLQYSPNKPDEWSLRHEGNLDAFGYVQASKTEKKFMDCAPDLSYALICESHHHLFLYRSNNDSASGLRNRSGPQITVGKQHLIELDNYGDVLGIATSAEVVTLLTENNLLHLQII